MGANASSQLIMLTYEALLRSFWRKESLRKFLRGSGVAEAHVAGWSTEETKRSFLDRTFAALQRSEKGVAVVGGMARQLAAQTSFPDLRGWENSEAMIAEARQAVAELATFLSSLDKVKADEKERIKTRESAQALAQQIRRSEADKDKLRSRLEAMHVSVGTQAGGYEFERWFFDLLDYAEIPSRRPYVAAGRQIDGSLTLEGTTYLVELKFTGSQVGAPDVDSLRAKVDDKADNTMGIMVSISGYSKVAIQSASGRQSKLLMLDAPHLFLFLVGSVSFAEVISRIRRNASQTGQAYLSAADFHL